MRFLRAIRQHPLALLAVASVAFVGWVWWDALPSGDPIAQSTTEAVGPMRTRDLPLPPEFPDEEPDPTRGIPKLKPGMMRAEVEKLVGGPVDNRVSPATVTDGRVTYHAAYEADFGPAATVRPIARTRVKAPVEPTAPPVDRTLVTLEFDASKPGHPLVGVHYPDPLF